LKKTQISNGKKLRALQREVGIIEREEMGFYEK